MIYFFSSYRFKKTLCDFKFIARNVIKMTKDNKDKPRTLVTIQHLNNIKLNGHLKKSHFPYLSENQTKQQTFKRTNK